MIISLVTISNIMTTQYKNENNKIIIEIPYWSDRHEPFTYKVTGKHVTLVGQIVKRSESIEDYGFGYVIDMDYKDKNDQFTSIMFRYTEGGKEEFIELCKKLKIDYVEYTQYDPKIENSI